MFELKTIPIFIFHVVQCTLGSKTVQKPLRIILILPKTTFFSYTKREDFRFLSGNAFLRQYFFGQISIWIICLIWNKMNHNKSFLCSKLTLSELRLFWGPAVWPQKRHVIIFWTKFIKKGVNVEYLFVSRNICLLNDLKMTLKWPVQAKGLAQQNKRERIENPDRIENPNPTLICFI